MPGKVLKIHDFDISRLSLSPSFFHYIQKGPVHELLYTAALLRVMSFFEFWLALRIFNKKFFCSQVESPSYIQYKYWFKGFC